MSADLFAEFGNFSQAPQKNNDNKAQAKSATPYTASNNASADPFAFLSPSSPPAQAPFPSSIPPSFQSQTPAAPWLAGSIQSQSNTGFGGEDSWASLTGGNSNGNSTKDAAAEDDGWGNFEVASPVDDAPAFSQPLPPSLPSRSQAMPDNRSFAEQRTRIVRASTLDLISNNLVDVTGPGPGTSGSKLETYQERPSWESGSLGRPTPPPKDPPKPKNADPNVLFDAEDYDPDDVMPEDDGDDFGDFETVSPLPKPSGTPAFDLMSSDWASTNSMGLTPASSDIKQDPPSQQFSTLNISNSNSHSIAPKSPSFQERNPFPGLAVTTPRADEFPKETGEVTSPQTAWPTADRLAAPASQKTSFVDDWAAFDDFASSKQEQSKAAQQSLGWDWDAADNLEKVPAPQKSPQPQPKAAATRPALSSTTSSKPPAKVVDTEPDSSWDWDATDEPSVPSTITINATTQAPPDTTPAPTNIPPPSIMLSLFPSIFDLPNTALFQPTASTSTSIRARVLADPQTATFLSGFLALATVAARLITGRKLRWQRDRYLSQRMAISEVGGKGGRGMKLASIDRSQAMRDDQTMHDVLDVWKVHIGKLRSAVAAANGAAAGLNLKIPELGEAMTVQTVKMALGAPKPCALCGLKRDERVKGIDVEVEDSFGEWWVEHWGHRACRNFWYEHEEQLRSR